MGKAKVDLNSVTTVGLDLAKHVFQIHAVDADSKIVVAHSLVTLRRRRPRLRGFSGREFEVELRICACGQAQPTAAS